MTVTRLSANPYDGDYRRKIIAAFGKAEPAEYDRNGLCTLCQEPEHSCPGYHAPETSPKEDNR